MMRNFVFLAFLGAGILHAQSSSPLDVLPWHTSMPTAFNAYLMRRVHEQDVQRREELSQALSSLEAMHSYQDGCRKRYRAILGEFPVTSNLNPVVTGTSQESGYRIEKVIYESFPRHHVTADLYIPDGQKKHPAVLIFCGHSANGKIAEQEIAQNFVQNGFVAFVIDPISQGERFQITDSTGRPLTQRATSEHTLLNAGSNVVGTGVVAYELYDNVRGLDYLVTRSEVDTAKIGCLGTSGGGTQTAYFIGYDPRIKVAAPSSFIAVRERTLELYGASDGCQHIPYEGREHLEIEDFLIAFAPKPLLILAGRFDFVDYWGVTSVVQDLKKVYTTLHQSKKIDLFTGDCGHGMPKQEQDAAIKWFRRWLCNDTIVKDISISKLSAEKLQCTKTGQVTTAFRDKEMTLPQWNVQLAQQYTAKRKEFLSSGKEHIKSTIANLLGITLSLPKIEAEQTGTGTTPAGSYNKFIIHRAEQVPVPCIVFYPKNLRPSSRIIFELNEKGKNEIAANDSLVKSITDGGDILLLADLRGYGETTDPKEYNEQKYATKEYRNAMISLHIGNPLIGQRVIDIISILDFCNVEPDLAHHPVAVYANGTYGPAVLHAAYLDGRIVKVQLEKSIKSYEEFLMNPLQNEMYTNVLYGVLQYYDLPNLIEKIGVNKVQIR